jgi:signal transduction histidine kinase
MARIVLLLEGRENSGLLHEWLSQYHALVDHVTGEALEETCDLCIVDENSLRRFMDELQHRREKEKPGMFPVLLLTPHKDVWSHTPGLWHYVDDSVQTPVSKLELQARIEILLRARQYSLELKIRNEDLDALIQAMSHDLKASVRAVNMFTEALASKSEQFDEESRQDLGRIRWAASEMREQIDALLNFSRLGRGDIRYELIDLRSYIENCLRNLAAEIQSRQAQIHLKTRQATVHTDPTLLKIALTNLVSNAIKFVPEGIQPEITISSRIRNGVCRIRVNDNGIGIAPENQHRIFTPFVRLHGDEEIPGMGLGLPSVRKVLELMGGRVGVQSNLGRGSTFWIEFPP